jgi:hypothetical protein
MKIRKGRKEIFARAAKVDRGQAQVVRKID